jgi:hypothetical protein
VKKIVFYREAIGAGSASYQFHVGNSDHSLVYGETSSSATISDEIDLEITDGLGFLEDNVISWWATGAATSVTTRGYGYVEYI